MTTLNTHEKKLAAYKSEMKRLDREIDAWYEIASCKFAAGNKVGQRKAYDEIAAIEVFKSAMVNPEEDEILTGDESWLEI